MSKQTPYAIKTKDGYQSAPTFKEVMDSLSFQSHDSENIKAGIRIKYTASKYGETEEIRRKRYQEMQELIHSNKDLTLYLHKNSLLMQSVMASENVNYAAVASDLAGEFKDEFGCTKPSEIILCQLAANAYVRVMRLSMLMFGNYLTGEEEYLSNEKNQRFSIQSKELDRAERQLQTALNNLRNLRQPTLKVNIKTQNAFVAQNQQLNNTNENNNAN